MRKTVCFGFASSAVALAIACSSSSSPSSSETSGGDASANAPIPDSGMPLVDSSLPVTTEDGASSTPDSSPSQGSDGAASDADFPPDVLAPLEDGGELVQFVSADETTYFDKSQEEATTGTITFGQANAAASDDAVASLLRTGGEATIGTGGAEEIVSNRMFAFGTFRFRLSLATCATTEEVVNGPFSYFNDGSKAADGLVINREVDIEILCGEPYFINLTIWTEYTDDTHLKNQSRVVDMRTGTVSVYADDTEGDETGTESHPELASPGWPVAGTFYEMGYEWAPDHLRYFIDLNGQELTLWDATDATRIPQLPMEQHFNIWAPGEHWSTGDTAAVPANNTSLLLDWFRYDPQ